MGETTSERFSHQVLERSTRHPPLKLFNCGMECVAQRLHIGKGWAVGCAYQQREKVVSPECKADVGFFSFLLFFFSLALTFCFLLMGAIMSLGRSDLGVYLAIGAV